MKLEKEEQYKLTTSRRKEAMNEIKSRKTIEKSQQNKELFGRFFVKINKIDKPLAG